MAVYPERRGKRLSGKWIAEVTQAGERRRKRFDTKHEAERWADFTKLTGAAPPDAIPARPDHALGDVVKEALLQHPGWQSNRDPSRQQRLTYVVDVLGADTPVADIKTTDLDRLVTNLRKRPASAGAGKLSAGTINRYLAMVSAVLTFAQKRGYCPASIAFPYQKEEGRRIHWLTDEAEQAVSAAMLKAGKVDEELTLRVLTRTGMRWGEFEALEPGQVQGSWVKLDQTKTNTPRDIPIDPALGAGLLEMVKRGVPTYDTFRNCLRRALQSAGQNPKLSIHCLRHTTASRLVLGDVNLAIVQRFLGHRNISTTMRYTHVTDQSLLDASKKLSPQAGQTPQIAPQEQACSVQETPVNEGEVDGLPILEPWMTAVPTDKQ